MSENQPKIMKIALFGTSADPPTAGHQAILEGLSQRYDLVAVWASDNPFKQHYTSLTEREKMLGLLLGEINNTGNILLRTELSDRRSLISLGRAREIWGQEPEYTIVIGSDLVEQIQSWYKIKDLVQQVKILIVPRLGYEIKTQSLENLSNLGGKYAIAQFHVPDISSSNYRQQGDQSMLTEAVANYIHQQRLYKQL